MIPVAKAGDLCAAIYGSITPGVFNKTFTAGQITVGYALINGVATFSFAGSESVFDWLRDFIALPFNHPLLGTVHQGFWDDMDAVWLELQPLLTGNIAIQGHSLGCAHAALLTGLCGVNKIHVGQLTLFAPPRPGYAQLKDIVQKNCDRVVSFWNGIDPVPQVPLPLPDQPWKHVAPLTRIVVPPKGLEVIIPTDWHNLDLYRNGTRDYQL
jgi:pimeloyl-ACP methyl ester carboxylesterase